MTIKKWFMEKEFSASERYAIETGDEPAVARETEKAVLLKWDTDFGTISHWVPKSCIETVPAPSAAKVGVGMLVTNPKGETITVAAIDGPIAIGTNGIRYALCALRAA